MHMGHRVVGGQHIGFSRARSGTPDLDTADCAVGTNHDGAARGSVTQTVVANQHALKSGQRWVEWHGGVVGGW